MTTEKNLADVASQIVGAVENIAPKTFELLVRAEFLSGVSLTLVFGLLSLVGFGFARFCTQKHRAEESRYDAGDWLPGIICSWFVCVACLAVALGVGLPNMIDPEAVAAAKLVQRVLQ